MSNSSFPCPLSTNHALLRPIAIWTLDTYGDDPPMLVGVELGSPTVSFHPIYLDDEDPLVTIDSIVAPPSWDLVVAVVEAYDAFDRVHSGQVVHCVDNEGRSATVMDDWCGRRRTLQAFTGRLHHACVAVLDRK